MIPNFLGARRRGPGSDADAGETRWAASDIPAHAANGGSPAEVIRQRLLANRGDLTQAGAMVTLLDPAQAWPRVVSHLLAPAAGEPANTVDLRNLVGLLPGTRIERVALPLAGHAKVKVYAVESRHGPQRRSLTLALAERSHLALVLASPLAPAAIDQVLDELQAAVAHPAWACPRLAFVLTAECEAWRHRIGDRLWPAALQLAVIDVDADRAAEAVLLGLQRAWQPAPGSPRPAAAPSAAVTAAPPTPHHPPTLATTVPAVSTALPGDLAALARFDAVRGLALVDMEFGQVLASAGQSGPALDTAASALAAALGLLSWRLGDGRNDELLLTRGSALLLLLRPCAVRPRQALVLMLDRAADLPLLRSALEALDNDAALARFQAG